MLVDVASTMPGSAFHASITRLEKKCFLSSNLAVGFSSFSGCPLDRLSLMLKWVAGSTFTKPFGILVTSGISALSRRVSFVVPFQCLECPSDQTSEQYSRCGLTRALYSGMYTVCMLLCVTVL